MLSSIDDFFDKIEYEGGACAALEYGLRAEDYNLPPRMAADWHDIVVKFRELDDLLTVFMKRYRHDDW